MLFGVLEIAAALAPSFWLFAALMVPIGMVGLTINVTANSSVQMATDPAMRGRVMSLFMMVFVGGTPLGAPLVGWITDAYGARIGFLAGGVVSAGRRGRHRPDPGPGGRPAPQDRPAPRPSARRLRAPGSGRSAAEQELAPAA